MTQPSSGQEKQVPPNYMWGINVFHPFPVPTYHKIGEFGDDTPNILSENHLNWIRFNIKWRDLMPPERWGQIPGDNDPLWRPYDLMIDGLKRKGIELLAVVACGQVDMISKNPGEVGSDEYIKVAGQLTEAIVQRYKDKIRLWEIENEVNAWAGHASVLFRFRKTTDPYWLSPSRNGFREKLMETLYRSVKAADKDAKVVAAIHYGAWAGEITGFRDNYIPKSYDVLGVTLYSHYLNIAPPFITPERVAADYVDRAVRFSSANGRPIIVLETGFPSGQFGIERNPYWTDEGQQKFVSAFVDAAVDHTDVVQGIFFYRFRDTNPPGFSVTIGSQPQEDFFGLVNYEGRTKSSWPAYGQKIQSYTPQKPLEVLSPYLLAAIAIIAIVSIAALVVHKRRRRDLMPDAPVSQSAFCLNCGQPIRKTAAFCPQCGVKIGGNLTE